MARLPEEKRRNIIKLMLGGATAFFVAPLAFVTAKYLSFTNRGSSATGGVKLSATELTPDNPSKLVEINDEPIIVVREQDNAIRAFTATCTHLGCTVSWKPQLNGFYCKCHQGRYDANGVNIPGTRPKSPLTELTVTQDGDDLQVELKPKAST